MNIFISYSTSDIAFAHRATQAIVHLANTKFWDRDKIPGDEDWKSIFGWIDAADAVIVFVSDSTLSRAMSVGQEVGYAKSKQKVIIPLVSDKVRISDLGCIKGVTAIRYDGDKPEAALRELQKVIDQRAREKQSDDSSTALLAIGAIFLLLLVAK